MHDWLEDLLDPLWRGDVELLEEITDGVSGGTDQEGRAVVGD